VRARRTALGWAGVASLVVLGLWPLAPSTAAGDEESVEVEDAAEAWYVSPAATPAADGAPTLPAPPPLPDVCTLPIGCPAGPPPVDVTALPTVAAAYPLGTLHVQATGGQRSAHSYVVPDTTTIPADASVVSGTLVLPLNKQDEGGNVSAETARMIACLNTEPVTDGVAGGAEEAPDFNCKKVSSKLKFDEKERSFSVDLTPFLQEWATGATDNYGIALVPALDLGPDATWQVTLNGDSVEKGKRASSTLVYRLADTTEPAPPAEPEEEAPEAAPPVTTGGGGGPAAQPAAPVPPPKTRPAESAPATAPQAHEQLQAAPFALLNSPWYSYRGVVFLPLAFLLALGLTGRSLTRPLARVTRR
jgi:hypothetical protein